MSAGRNVRTVKAAAAAAWLAASSLTITVGQEVGEFTLPEYDDNGVKTSEIKGRSAQVNTRSGTVDITDFKIEFYTPQGEVRMEVTSPRCTYNQRGKFAKSPSTVRIVAEKMTVTGEDFAWDGTKELFKIFKDSKVVIRGTKAGLTTPGSASKGDPANEE